MKTQEYSKWSRQMCWTEQNLAEENVRETNEVTKCKLSDKIE